MNIQIDTFRNIFSSYDKILIYDVPLSLCIKYGI